MKRRLSSPAAPNPEPLHIRVARLERCLGSLLIFLAAHDIVGPEDFSILEGVKRSRVNEPEPNQRPNGLHPEVPF